MSILIAPKISKNTIKIWYYFEWGKAKGQRVSTGIFTYTKPKNQIEKNHNKEALAILEIKRSQMILDHQAAGSFYVPVHKIKSNFLDFYSDFVKKNCIIGNRHLEGSYNAFKKFIEKDFISAVEIDENECENFRNYLLEHFNGETPSNYFHRFKKVIKAATRKGYFKINPAEDIKSKSRKNFRIKEILTIEEYQQLMNTQCLNYEVKKAFVVSLYTGLRWTDIKTLSWIMVGETSIKLNQNKTEVALEIPLHEIAKVIMGNRKTGLVFQLPTAQGANKILGQWCKDAGLKKHITWHCARHSFSVLLQRGGTDTATVAGMLGHTSTKYVHKTYKRYQLDAAENAIKLLPARENPGKHENNEN